MPSTAFGRNLGNDAPQLPFDAGFPRDEAGLDEGAACPEGEAPTGEVPAALPPPEGPQPGRPEVTRLLQRGLMRFLLDLDFAPLLEFPLPNRRRADAAGLGPKGEIWLFEIKSGPADFRADHKWGEYPEFSDQFYFVTEIGFPESLMPPEPGWVVADGFGGGLMRPAPLHPLPAMRRKALTLAFARTLAFRRMAAAKALTLTAS